ncbi:hypothetical protein MalM25_04790 [Planctomycetes bacterium MalM25]|nr:hypothetical protein MalM25_04790 [Planctomycetes bacterium MalM25]
MASPFKTFGTLAAIAMLASPFAAAQDWTFEEDATFLAEHTEVVVLRSADGAARVAVAPAYQGRVMTSTGSGGTGASHGWINYDHIRAGVLTPHINHYGGEERFWLGPDGGQFTCFYPRGAEFTPDNWQVPAAIDSEPYSVVEKSAERVAIRHRSSAINYSLTTFEFQIDREIAILSTEAGEESLGVAFDGASAVGYRSTNRLTNTGANAWTRQGGQPSIWLLGMYPGGPEATVVVPYREGDEKALGPIVNDRYLGDVPDDRLKVIYRAIYFRGDARQVTKIGVSAARSRGVCGAWDAERGTLTITKYEPPSDPDAAYVNSMLELQDEPYVGDAIHSYNDGPPADDPDRPATFYELETSSPAQALGPGDTGQHAQETYHFQGPREAIDRITRGVLGVSLEEIEAAF